MKYLKTYEQFSYIEENDKTNEIFGWSLKEKYDDLDKENEEEVRKLFSKIFKKALSMYKPIQKVFDNAKLENLVNILEEAYLDDFNGSITANLVDSEGEKYRTNKVDEFGVKVTMTPDYKLSTLEYFPSEKHKKRISVGGAGAASNSAGGDPGGAK